MGKKKHPRPEKNPSAQAQASASGSSSDLLTHNEKLRLEALIMASLGRSLSNKEDKELKQLQEKERTSFLNQPLTGVQEHNFVIQVEKFLEANSDPEYYQPCVVMYIEELVARLEKQSMENRDFRSVLKRCCSVFFFYYFPKDPSRAFLYSKQYCSLIREADIPPNSLFYSLSGIVAFRLQKYSIAQQHFEKSSMESLPKDLPLEHFTARAWTIYYTSENVKLSLGILDHHFSLGSQLTKLKILSHAYQKTHRLDYLKDALSLLQELSHDLRIKKKDLQDEIAPFWNDFFGEWIKSPSENENVLETYKIFFPILKQLDCRDSLKSFAAGSKTLFLKMLEFAFYHNELNDLPFLANLANSSKDFQKIGAQVYLQTRNASLAALLDPRAIMFVFLEQQARQPETLPRLQAIKEKLEGFSIAKIAPGRSRSVQQELAMSLACYIHFCENPIRKHSLLLLLLAVNYFEQAKISEGNEDSKNLLTEVSAFFYPQARLENSGVNSRQLTCD